MKLLTLFTILSAFGIAFFFGPLPGIVESSLNRVMQPPPYVVTETAAQLHRRLQVVDLHADTLLWNRRPMQLADRGQVDVPRLIEGGVALQAFTIVTKSPRGMNIEKNDDDSDNVTLLAIAQLWPARTWRSLTERALYQIEKLRLAEASSDGRFTVIESSKDLAQYLKLRKANPAITAGFIGIEGAHALDGDLANIDRLHEAGVRMMAPTHFFDTDLGGSAHGLHKGGLTEKGREMIRRMESKGMILDLAHASAKTFADALELTTRPVVVSHTGVRGTCNNNRNLSDAQLRAIAVNGGVVGIGYWETAVCGTDATAIATAIEHAVRVAGIDHVALGSDFDGSVSTPFDARGVPLVTEALMARGMSESHIAAVMGGNALRLLMQGLPEQ